MKWVAGAQNVFCLKVIIPLKYLFYDIYSSINYVFFLFVCLG